MKDVKRIVVPLAGGEDRGTEPQIARGLLTSRDVLFARRGSVDQRHGFEEIAGTYTEGRIAALRDVPVLFGTRVRVGLSANAATAHGAAMKLAGTEDWTSTKCDLVDASLLTSVIGTGDNPSHVDVGGSPANGWLAVALSYPGQILLAAIDIEHHVILAERWVSVTGTPAVHIVTSANGDTWALYIDRVTFKLTGTEIAATAIAAPAALHNTHTSTTTRAHIFDCCALDGDNIAVVFVENAPSTAWRLLIFNASTGAVDGTVDWAFSNAPQRVGVFRYTTNAACVAMVEGNDGTDPDADILARGYTSALANTFSVTVDAPASATAPMMCYAIGGVARSATSLTIYYTMGRADEEGGGGVLRTRGVRKWQRWNIRACDITNSGGWAAGTPAWWLYSARQLSRPFIDATSEPAMVVGHLPRVETVEPGTDVFWPFAGAVERTQLGSAFVVRDDRTGPTYYRPTVVAKAALDRTWLPLDRDWSTTAFYDRYERHLSHLATLGSRVFASLPLQAIPEARRTRTRASSGGLWGVYDDIVQGQRGGGLGVLDFDQAPTEKPRIIEARDWLLIPGGLPCEFDGRLLVEQGFLVYPEDVTVRRFDAVHGVSDLTNVASGTGYPLTAGSSISDACLVINAVRDVWAGHCALMSGSPPTSQVHIVSDNVNPSTSALATDEATCIARANNIKAVFNSHRVDTAFHFTPDTINAVTGADATNWDTLWPLINEIFADYAGHRVAHGAGLVSGTVRYAVVAHWVDESGNGHWSAPVFTDTITVPSSDGWTVAIDIASLQLTKRDAVEFFVYRTKDGPGPSYYYIGTVQNSRAAETVSVYDSTADADLLGSGPYTSGGIVEHVQPPPHRMSTVWQGRHVVVPRDYESWMLWYSQPAAEKGGFGHNEIFQLWLNPAGGRVTGLEVLGDRLIVFKAGRILAVDGQGLDATGQGMGYAEPVLISQSVGCTDARSIVQTPAGLMFKSATGIMLLDRLLQVQPVGQPMRYYTDSQTIVCGLAVPELDVAIWLCGSGEYALVYNWRFGRWATWSQPDAVDACVIDGQIWAKSSSRTGKVIRETRTSWLDWGTTWIPAKVRLPWLALGEIGGFQKVLDIMIAGHRRGAGNLTLRIAYDHDPRFIDEVVRLTAQLTAFGPSEHYGAMTTVDPQQALLFKQRASRSRCEAVLLEVESTSPGTTTPTGPVISLTAAAFDIVTRDGQHRVGSNRRQ